jgi:ammonia channel protein AmtB
MIVVGGAFERGNILPSLIFSFFWATLVYCPVARWTWSSHGWLYNLPALDFAGGGPVHIASGWALPWLTQWCWESERIMAWFRCANLITRLWSSSEPF